MIFRKSLLIFALILLATVQLSSANLKKTYFTEQKHLNFEATTTNTTTETTTPNNSTQTAEANTTTEKTTSTNESSSTAEEELCTKKYLKNLTLVTEVTGHKSICAFAKDKCPGDVVNWFGILFCQLGGDIWLFILISIVAIYAIFVFTSATVDEFIAEGITAMAEAMNLSDAMAAVTLIALANGAGDVITALVASGSDGGVSYNIGSLYGAGFFVAACVIALTIRIYCQETNETFIQLDKSLFFRDILIYVLATVVTIVFAFTDYIRWWQAVIYLVIYAALVIIVAIQDRYQKVEDQKLLGEQEQKAAQREVNLKKGFQNKTLLGKIQKAGKTITGVVKIQKAVSLRKFRQIELEKKKEEREKEFAEQDYIGRFTYIIDYIPKALRTITMMPANKEEYDKYLVAFWPLGGFVFLFWAFKLSFQAYVFAGLPISIILTFILWFFLVKGTENKEKKEEGAHELKQSKKKQEKKDQESAPVLPTQQLSQEIEKEKKEEEEELKKLPRNFLLVQILSAITGLVWCFITISILMDLLNCFIVIFGLNNTFMGLTILGIGNALPDALTTLALSRQGYALMGIIGGYSGQLFGLLVGFGIAQLKTTLKSGKQEFKIFEKPVSNLLDIIALFVTLATLIMTIVYGTLKKFRFDKTIGNILLITYILFFVVACIVQVYYIYSGEGSK